MFNEARLMAWFDAVYLMKIISELCCERRS